MPDCGSGGPRLESRLGSFFFSYIPFNEEMNQKVKNKNNKNKSSNSLVFGQWPQTKIAKSTYVNIKCWGTTLLLFQISYDFTPGWDSKRGISRTVNRSTTQPRSFTCYWFGEPQPVINSLINLINLAGTT